MSLLDIFKSRHTDELQMLTRKVKSLQNEIEGAKFIDAEELIYTSGIYAFRPGKEISLHKLSLNNKSKFKLKIGEEELRGSAIIQTRDFLLKHFPVEENPIRATVDFLNADS